MADLHSRLYTRDDVVYNTQSYCAQRYGRIIAADTKSFTIQRYQLEDEDADELPAPLLSCVNVAELLLTEETENVPRVNVDDIIFVLSQQEIQNQPNTLQGMRRVHIIRFTIDHSSMLDPITEWSSFGISGPLSYPGFNMVRPK